MVRTYKKKSSRGSWSVESMKHAIDAVLSKSAGYRKAAQLAKVASRANNNNFSNKRNFCRCLYSSCNNVHGN